MLVREFAGAALRTQCSLRSIGENEDMALIVGRNIFLRTDKSLSIT